MNKLHTLRGDDTVAIRKTTGAGWTAETTLAELHQFASTMDILEAGAPLFAVAAGGSLKVETNPVNNDKLHIGGIDYTFKTTLSAPAVANQIVIGDNAKVTAINIVLALTAGEGSGSEYSTGTEANPKVTATSTDGRVSLIALDAGAAGNDIVVTAGDPESIEVTAMDGGVDNLLARPGQVLLSIPEGDLPAIYICVKETPLGLTENDEDADDYWITVATSAFPEDEED